MGKWIEPQIMLTRRLTAAGAATLREIYNSFADEYDEETGLSTLVIPDATAALEISMGTIAKGKLIFVYSDEPVTLHINGAGIDSALGTLFLHIADETTGITSIHVSNASGNSATVEILIAGDTTP